MQISELFKMDGVVDKKTATYTQILGWGLLIFFWWLFPTMGWINTRILPSPIAVFSSFSELIMEKGLLYNTGFSLLINVAGYLEAIAIAIPLGFLLGMFPGPKHLLGKQIDALRFVPIPAATGIFIALFGLAFGVKIHFLAFGIMVYLIPVVVQRIDEIDTIQKQTIWTLGAGKWKRIRFVYLPSVLSRVSDDVRVLVAVSWTYIVVAELINNQGGLGGLAYLVTRASRTDMLYAILIEIIFIGFIQDKLFRGLDLALFRFKHRDAIKPKGRIKLWFKKVFTSKSKQAV